MSEETAPVHRFLTYRLARVQSKLNAQASKLLRAKAGLSLAQWRILSLIGGNPGTRATDLTRISTMDKGQFSRKLKTLVDDRLVVVSVDPQDHRILRLRLSDSGQVLYDRTLPHMRKRQADLKALLGPGEEEAFLGVLDKIEQTLERDLSRPADASG
ncbi:MAG: MarR family winged helix-turn-helix transcriptional regulator [Pseudomonadota bacterium]